MALKLFGILKNVQLKVFDKINLIRGEASLRKYKRVQDKKKL